MSVDFATIALRVDGASSIGTVEQFGAASERSAKQMERLEHTVKSAGATTVASTRNMGAWAALQAEAAGHVGEHSLALGRLGFRMEAAASEALGLNHVMGLLGGSFLKFGVGEIYSVAIIGGIYAISKAWEYFTEAEKKVKEEHDKLVQSLVQGNEDAALGPSPELSKQVQAQRDQVMQERERRRQLLAFGVSPDDDRIAELNRLIAYDQKQLMEADDRLTKARMAASTPLPTVRIEGESPSQIDAAFQKHIDLLSKGLIFDNQRAQITAELVGIEHQLEAQVNRGTLSLEKRITASVRLGEVQDALARKYVLSPLPTNPLQVIGATGNGETPAARAYETYGGPMQNVTTAGTNFIHAPGQPDLIGQNLARDLVSPLYKHEEAVQKMTEAYEAALAPFKSIDAAVDSFQEGLKHAATGLLEQFSPSNIAQGLVGGLASKVEGMISGLVGDAVGGIRHAVFGQSGAEKAATREAADAAHAMALQIDAVTKALGGDQLGAAIDALQIGLISSLQAINQALPGSKNEAERNRERQIATDQEAQNEARSRQQYAEQSKYAFEDLNVRNMRALGLGPQADLQSFKDQQERELQKAIDDNRDQTYINNLRLVENNELLAFLNGTLSDAVRNAPTGFYGAAAYIGDFASRSGSPIDSGITRPPHQSLPGGSSTNNPPPPRSPVNYNIASIIIDGSKSSKEIVTVLLDKLDQTAAASGGTGGSRAAALDIMYR